MKKTYLILMAVLGLFITKELTAQNEFITVWVPSGDEIIIPTLSSDYVYNYEAKWYDFSSQTLIGSQSNLTEDYSITGLSPYDTVEVRITGVFEWFYGPPSGFELDLIDVKQWGDIQWKNFNYSFWGCENLNITATDAPDLTDVNDLSYMFAGASSLTNLEPIEGAVHSKNNIGGWDVSQVVNMEGMFKGATQFNANIGGWDVSQVANMESMFEGATQFNANIGGWDVSQVISMEGAFSGASEFNADIGGWDVSQVASMERMFEDATQFNANIGGWDVSQVISMEGAFAGASEFNADIGGWDVSQVINMENIFDGAANFNRNIGGWDVSQLADGVTGASNHISFANSGMNCNNYSLTLQGWADQTNAASDVIIDATGINYSSEVAADRDHLINNKNWTISGDIEDPSCFLAVEEFNATSFIVYPNPAQNQLTIDGLNGNENIEVKDMMGRTLQIVKTQNKTTQSIEVNGLANGVYNLIISNEKGQSVTRKFIKQ